MLVRASPGQIYFAISEEHKTFLNEHSWWRVKLVLFFSLISYWCESSFAKFVWKNFVISRGTSIVANNDMFLKSLQRRPVTSTFFTRDMCGAVINERRTVERNEKRWKLGNYSHLCDVKECNVGVRARLRGNYEKSHVEYLFTAQKESIVLAKMLLFFLHAIWKIFLLTLIYR